MKTLRSNLTFLMTASYSTFTVHLFTHLSRLEKNINHSGAHHPSKGFSAKEFFDLRTDEEPDGANINRKILNFATSPAHYICEFVCASFVEVELNLQTNREFFARVCRQETRQDPGQDLNDKVDQNWCLSFLRFAKTRLAKSKR
jgi:hypothetical protein